MFFAKWATAVRAFCQACSELEIATLVLWAGASVSPFMP
jgi:hypothetical protein